MKSRMKRFPNVLALILIAAILLGIQSCNKDNNEPAPQIPPVSTFLMDFEGFQDDDTTGIRGIETCKNWWWAATHVKVWNTLIKVGLAIPVASFVESFNHEAVYDPESGTWTWSYNFWVHGIAHKAELNASLVTEGIMWEMFISKDGEYSNFLWYYGISGTGGTDGYWQLYNNPTDNQPLLLITWNRDPVNGTADIKYENIVPGGAENGGYIFYGITNNTPYNAFYDIFNKGQDNMINIQWHLPNLEGQVKDALHFGDEGWHCWNNLLQDTSCP